MGRWQSEIDRAIEKMRDEGAFDNLPGEGKPLNLGDETYVPDEMRMAYRILAQNDMAPDWVILGKEIQQAEEAIRATIARQISHYHEALAQADSMIQRQHAESSWSRAYKALEAEVKGHNERVLGFNLKVPRGVAHRPMLDLHQEMAKRK